MSFTTSTGHFDQLMLGAPFSLHGFPAPSRRRFPALPCGVIAVYPMQTVMRFSRCGAGFGNKKSPHNNLNLTILSGMALVRVRYVAIRKSKTCSDSFRSRAGTLSKYVILNCWNRLPQKSSHGSVPCRHSWTADTTAYTQWVSGEVRFHPDKRIPRHNPLSTYHSQIQNWQ